MTIHLFNPGGFYGARLDSHETDSELPLGNDEVVPSNIGVFVHSVCSPADQHLGMSRLSVNNRGPSPNFGLTGPFSYTATKPSSSEKSLNETQGAGYAPLAADDGRQSYTSPLPDWLRNYTTQTVNNEPRKGDSSANTGEMFFDLNMERVQPRRLKKKTTEERESYLRVRRQGGACKEHKFAKRAVSSVSYSFAKILRFS